jgi:hypothetical protein
LPSLPSLSRRAGGAVRGRASCEVRALAAAAAAVALAVAVAGRGLLRLCAAACGTLGTAGPWPSPTPPPSPPLSSLPSPSAIDTVAAAAGVADSEAPLCRLAAARPWYGAGQRQRQG